MWDWFIGNGTIITLLVTFNVPIKSDGREWEKKMWNILSGRKNKTGLKKKIQGCKTACMIVFYIYVCIYTHTHIYIFKYI